MKSKIVAAFVLALALASCKKDKPETVNSGGDCSPTDMTNKVFITNEGKFMAGNSSVTLFDGNTGCKMEDIYNTYNTTPLGDICQSMTKINGYYYIVVNNSQKIVVVNSSTYKKVTEITGFTSPRYITQVSATRAYVSDLFGNSISIVNLSNNTIAGNISLPGWTEEMLFHNGKVYVTNSSSNYLYIVDAVGNTITDSIAVGTNSNSLRLDKNGKIWVLCGGSSWGTLATGSLTRINPANNQIEMSVPFASPYDSPGKLNINATADTLYYLSNGVKRIAITDASLPTSNFIAPQGSAVFYGLGIDPSSGTIYIGDAKDFNQKGEALRYTRSGAMIDKFATGISPNGFYFY